MKYNVQQVKRHPHELKHVGNLGLKKVGTFILWTESQDFCPYTHEPINERLILSETYHYPNQAEIERVAKLNHVSASHIHIGNSETWC